MDEPQHVGGTHSKPGSAIFLTASAQCGMQRSSKNKVVGYAALSIPLLSDCRRPSGESWEG